MKIDFLKDEDFLLPNPRIVNGFRILPIWSAPNSYGDKRIIWMITPNRSVRCFFFLTLDSASDFAKQNSNCHTDNYWFKRFKRQFHFAYVSRLAFDLCHEPR